MPSRPVDEPEQHREVADAFGPREHETLLRQQAEAEHVDERVVAVAVVEHDLAADRGHADRVAVAADARDDALEQVPGARVVERSEAQRVHERDRAGAHGEDVADDPAHAGGGTLVRLDGGGMVVALDADRDGEPVADVDHAGALTRPDEHPRRVGGEVAEVDLRRLVRAVLRPHHGVHGELELGRVTTEQVDDVAELVVGEPEPGGRLSMDGQGSGWCDAATSRD